MKLFSCPKPVIAAAMNQVSDVKLATAVSQAGAQPSMTVFNYQRQDLWTVDLERLCQDLERFRDQTNGSQLILSLGEMNLQDHGLLELIEHSKVSHIELIFQSNILNMSQVSPELDRLRQAGVEVLGKSLGFYQLKLLETRFPGCFSGWIVKNSQAAGRISYETRDFEKDLTKTLDRFPDLVISASGGVGTAEQVKHYLDLGCDSVCLGTVFAASQESCLSLEAKNSMIRANSQDLVKFTTSNQQALFFSKIVVDDYNHTDSLKKGITTGDQGHIFAGTAIDHVKQIRTVQEILDDLTRLIS